MSSSNIKPLQTMKTGKNKSYFSSPNTSLRPISSDEFDESRKNLNVTNEQALAGTYDQVGIPTKTYVEKIFALNAEVLFRDTTINGSKGVHGLIRLGDPRNFAIGTSGKAGAAFSMIFHGQISEIMCFGIKIRLITSVKNGRPGFGVLTRDTIVDHKLRLAGLQKDPNIAIRNAVRAYLAKHPEKLPKLKTAKKKKSSNDDESSRKSAAAESSRKKRARVAEAADRLPKKRKGQPTKYGPLMIEIDDDKLEPGDQKFHRVNPPQGRDAFGINQRILMVAGFARLRKEDLPLVLQRLREEYATHDWSPEILRFVIDQFEDLIPETLKTEFSSMAKTNFCKELAPIATTDATIEDQPSFASLLESEDVKEQLQTGEATLQNVDAALVTDLTHLRQAAQSDLHSDHPGNLHLSRDPIGFPRLGLRLANEGYIPQNHADVAEVMHELNRTPMTIMPFTWDSPSFEDADFREQLQNLRPPTPRGDRSLS